ncbi:unnamed protein product [Schistosoma rodhaini]|nr:unnamed protein product [Schistosoma rodhaini]CAH8533754.1 unnamed protein product [Schistosoma rodhaini]CAH8533772.1 unnamed protein product [Schistosoma rodhaini]
MYSPSKLSDMDPVPVTTHSSSSNFTDIIFSPVNAISEFKLPPYGVNNPRIWFAQIEALFQSRGVRSQASKYPYVVSLLQIKIAAEVGDLIDQVPETEPYDK